jgi:Rps23 Pro-64 3,4-dihydroxylase Tpa1-like proline 4-hydroxylase
LLVAGDVLLREAPWLFDLYETEFLRRAQQFAGVPTYTAKSPLYAINLNVQWGQGMVYECHVDSNPVQGMLYTATLENADGGALVVGLNPEAKSIEEVDADCQEIHPKANHLVLFDARYNPHYVRPMTEGHARVAVAMNFYTDESPEAARPKDLSKHLFGRDR